MLPPPFAKELLQRRRVEFAIDVAEIPVGPEQVGYQQAAMHAKVYHRLTPISRALFSIEKEGTPLCACANSEG
jgi:hypothetical protein